MQINRHFDEATLLGTLNGHASIRVGFGGQEHPEATSLLMTTLRGLVDEWLDSARRADDVEEPHKRRIGNRGEQVLAKFVVANGVSRSLIEGGGGETKLFLPSERRTNDPIADAKYNAILQFSELLDHPEAPRTRERIARCRRCGTYFCSPRRLEDVYKNGIFCKWCRHRASAERSQGKSRNAWRDKVLSLAAKAWLRWEERPRRGDQVKWIVDEVNEHLQKGKEKPIRRNWIKLNKAKIQEAAKALAEGKSVSL